MQQTAQAAQDVTNNLEGVRGAANATGSASTEVLSAAGELSHQSTALAGQIERFIIDVKAA